MIRHQEKFRASGVARRHLLVRLLMTFLLVGYVNYTKLHLLTSAHHHDPASAEEHHHQHAEDDDHRHGKPRSHSSSDHAIQMVAKWQKTIAGPEFVPSQTVPLTPAPVSTYYLSFLEWVEFTGEPPPDPLLPRAPPFC